MTEGLLGRKIFDFSYDFSLFATNKLFSLSLHKKTRVFKKFLNTLFNLEYSMIYNVLEFGIIGDGVTDNTASLNKLAEKIGSDGGGVMYFPCGKYVTGSVEIKSGTTVNIESGATILGSENFNDFPFIEYKGFTRGSRRPLLWAQDAENIKVSGGGVIDCRGKIWWESGKDDLERPRAISAICCKDILIENITVTNSPCWTIHPICCENVSVLSVNIKNPYNSPNTDGINPESCKNVRILNCFIDVGDDCIAIKAGTERDLLQKSKSCENITISGCTMAHGHGGVVFGSEMSGGVSNVLVTECVFKNTDRGIRLKTRRGRGGSVSGIVVKNITMENVLACITVNEYYIYGGTLSAPKEVVFSKEKQKADALTPKISGINISEIVAKGVKGVGIYIYGLPEQCPEDINIENIDFDIFGEEGVEAVMAYDREKSFGDGIFLENAKNVTINNAKIKCCGKELTVISCENITLNGDAI